jgi:amino acid permease
MREGNAMSQIATHETHRKRARPATVHGAPWFGLMVAVWSAFVTLLVVSPETLANAWSWLTGLPLLAEIFTWIFVLPWALSYAVWESSWDHWLRVAIVALFAAAHLIVSAPRAR